VFVLAEHEDPKQRHYLNLYKMGEGPLYPFWTPYHLVHFETPFSIARVVLFGDELAPPLGGPVVEVCALAKRDLKAGEVLDGEGGYMVVGRLMPAADSLALGALPLGLAQQVKLVNPVKAGRVLCWADVAHDAGAEAVRVRREMESIFAAPKQRAA